ncbi:hypothetical protein [Alcaligenes sp. SDU_A2]
MLLLDAFARVDYSNAIGPGASACGRA